MEVDDYQIDDDQIDDMLAFIEDIFNFSNKTPHRISYHNLFEHDIDIYEERIVVEYL